MEHYAAWSSKQNPHKKTWSKPPPECFKVNFDVVSCEDFSTQSAVCRNSNGVIIKMVSQFWPPCSAIYGAALAAHLAGFLVSSLQLNKFILEGVSNVIMSAFMSPTQSMDGQIEHVVQDTISSFPPSSLWEAKNIFRSENFCALYVAYRVATRVLLGCISSLVSPPGLFPFVVRN
jgi:hypothetical protein